MSEAVSHLHDLVDMYRAGNDDSLTSMLLQWPVVIDRVRAAHGMTPVELTAERPRWYSVPLADGTTGYLQRRTDDCWTACVATVLQMPPQQVPDLQLILRKVAGHSEQQIMNDTGQLIERWLRSCHLRLWIHDVDDSRDRWIGVVNSATGSPMGTHSLVMHHGEVLFDPGVWLPDRPNSRTNRSLASIDYGLSIEVID